MTTTLSLPSSGTSIFNLTNGWGFQPNVYRKGPKRTLVVEHLAAFRSGTFRDSMGYQNTWEDLHIRQMQENYNHLTSNRLFENVPVRDGHPGWLINGTPGTGRVVGWHTAVVAEKAMAPHDNEEYDYLFVDFEILDGQAADDYEAGLLRNRSAEIIRYGSNAEAEYWPVYGGFAFVDISAVEGLNFSRDTSAGHGYVNSPRLFVMFDKEIPSMTTTSGAPALNDRPPLGAPGQQAHVFSINGQPVSDFAAVQRHITALETQQAEARTAGRAEFIERLAHGNLIAATGIEAFTQAAAKMDDETWALFCKGYETAQPPALLSQHAAPAANTGGSPSSNNHASHSDDEAVTIAKEIVAGHRSNGMPLERLKTTPSYRKLVEAGIEQA